MIEYVREGEDRFGNQRSEQLLGAILCRGGRTCDLDSWRLCYDLAEMLRQDSRAVIYGGTAEQIESEIWKRYPIEGEGVALVVGNGMGTGWRIERTPRLMHADLNLLRQACAIHKRVLVGDDLIEELGGRERLTSLGFLLADRRSRWAQLVRHNPRQVGINRWKGQVEELSQYSQPEFPAELMQELFAAVRPESWQHGHPCKGLLKTECSVTTLDSARRGWGSVRHRRGRRCRQVNLSGAAGTILTFVRFAGKLSAGEHRRPWRRSSGWKELLERMVPYVRGVQRHGDEDCKRLALWVRAEARAEGVKLPPAPKLPPRPVFGKNRKRPPRPASPLLQGATHERTGARVLQAVS